MTHTRSDAVYKTTVEVQPKRRRLRIQDPDFVPPDGGWGWLIVVACGFSNLCIFPMFAQFGLVFREKFEALGITNAQTTTVININQAFNSCVGLVNGPLFRTFSYRQVALAGAILVSLSLFTSTFCSSFGLYIVFFSMCYGSGIGMTQSANALALNIYFKNRRRIATGFSWTMTALGPIIWPYVITWLVNVYGTEGTLMIFSAFAAHAIMFSLLLQPVHWHTKFRDAENGTADLSSAPLIQVTSEKVHRSNSKPRSVFSSQYLNNEDDYTGYEIVDPGTPMLALSNDGWYSNKSLGGSRVSLTSYMERKVPSKMPSGQNSVAMSQLPSYNNLLDARSRKSSSANLAQDAKDRKRERKTSHAKPAIQESVAEDCPSEKAPQDLKEEEKLLLSQKVKEPVIYPNEKEVLKTAAIKLAEYKETEEKQNHLHVNGNNKHPEEELEPKRLSFFQKVIIFFDFDLLKDPIYVNLMLGITFANFAEIDFSILTPFVLKEFEFEKIQIATFMSVLGAMDMCSRFFVPFVAEKIGWQNKTFFLIGVLCMAFGRIILVHTRTYSWSILVAVIIGFGKGLRTIFIALVIPSYVPLERLPAASGLQLASCGLAFLLLAPVVGWIRDAVSNYVITLHILNIMTYITAISWTVEDIITRKKRRLKETAPKK